MVAAGHVTTQNLGGKKICWVGGVAECFNCLIGFLRISAQKKQYLLSLFML